MTSGAMGGEDPLRKKISELEASLKEANLRLGSGAAELEAYEALLKLSMEDMQRIYEDLLKTHSQLTQSDKLATIGMLSAGIVHEINNPLTVIQGSFYLLKNDLQDIENLLNSQGVLSPEKELFFKNARQKLEQGLRCTSSITKIVRDIRVFSRSDKGERVTEDVNGILDGVISIAWNVMKNKAELIKSFGEIPKISCNAQQLGQVFLNLIVNASQAIQGKGTIQVSTFFEEPNVKIEISDTGSGMPEEVQKRIFEPFFTTKGAETGTGLGLSISADIIKKHSGTIQVKSQVGQGTTFTILLPVSGG